MVQDLRSYAYEPANPAYKGTLGAVMAIFDPVEGPKIDLTTRIDPADALAVAGDQRFADPDANLVRIEAGIFRMGAQKTDPSQPNYDEQADGDEAPVHEVTLRAFEIVRYPVTVGEYERLVDDEGYRKEELWAAGGFGEREVLRSGKSKDVTPRGRSVR
jgi:formylglycine-generating enzyme required for sulfatase activity